MAEDVKPFGYYAATRAIADELRAFHLDGEVAIVNPRTCVNGAEWLERLNRQVEIIYCEREHARACFDRTTKLLLGIHAMLYPAPVTVGDRTMVFRPNNPDPHTTLQELSDRIRALPDELANISTGA